MVDKHDYETGNTTVNAMFRNRTVRVAVSGSATMADRVEKLNPGHALRLSEMLRVIPPAFLYMTNPEGVADALEHEVKRLEAEVGGDV